MEKMKFKALGFCLLVMSMLFVGCGGGKYSEVEKTTYQVVDLMEEFAADAEAANSAEAAAKAINKFADGMEALKPKLEKLEAQFPELEDENNMPAELEEVRAKTDEVAKKMTGSMMKMMSYMQDPKMMEAMQRLQNLDK